MRTRTYPGFLLAFVCFAAGFAPALPAQRVSAPLVVRPNIVFVITDDFAINLVPFMPNVLKMQQDGATFSNYFVSSSLSRPSRSSIFTGMFPHNTGVLTNHLADGGLDAFTALGNERHTIAVAVQAVGYRTALLGKYLHLYHPRTSTTPPGWTTWIVAGEGFAGFNYDLNENGQVRHYGRSPDAYLTDVIAGFADSVIRQPSASPFFVEIATFAPHKPYVPAPRDGEKFAGVKAPRSPMFGTHPGPSAPPWLQLTPPLRRSDIARIDQAFRLRAQSVQAVDRMIGQLRATLATLGLDKTTYFVFSSDNGLHMGDYSLRPGTMTPFDTDVHVPLIIVGPGVARGTTLPQIVQNIDLAPTFAELAGASPPLTPDGRSFVTVLRSPSGATIDWRHAAFIEHEHPVADPADPDFPELFSANPPSYVAMRTRTALYVEYADGDRSFYDLTNDPLELINIARALPATTLKRLHDILHSMSVCKGVQACWNAQRGT